MILLSNSEMKEILGAILNKLDTMDAKMDGIANELTEFKKEMYEFRDEMYAFKDEMYAFKDEMHEFRNEVNEFRIETNKRFNFLDRLLQLLDVDLDGIIQEITENKEEIKRMKKCKRKH